MKLQFLGTAAAEGLPALWCNCDVCKRSRKLGGRAVRTRSQALIDDTLLIDFPADTYKHILDHNLDLTDITNVLITHAHSDHLYPKEFEMILPGFAHVEPEYCMKLFGSDKVKERFGELMMRICDSGRATFTQLEAFMTVPVGTYLVTALPATHAPRSGPLFYIISDGEKKLLYAHDTHFFRDDVWAYFKEQNLHFDLVSLDCTNACLPLSYVGHMGLAENIRVRDRMLEEGFADEKTIFVCNHFSHNAVSVVYDEFVPIAEKEGFLVSYDGMIVNV